MKIKQLKSIKTLCCPLCGSEDYLLSESDDMLCAECGSFFNDVTHISQIYSNTIKPIPNMYNTTPAACH